MIITILTYPSYTPEALGKENIVVSCLLRFNCFRYRIEAHISLRKPLDISRGIRKCNNVHERLDNRTPVSEWYMNERSDPPLTLTLRRHESLLPLSGRGWYHFDMLRRCLSDRQSLAATASTSVSISAGAGGLMSWSFRRRGIQTCTFH